jgi:hypothetical protein
MKSDTQKGPFGNSAAGIVPYATPSMFTTSLTPCTARTVASIPSLSPRSSRFRAALPRTNRS